MHTTLLLPQVQAYITEHLTAAIPQLALKKSPFDGLEMKELITQIEAKQKAKEKLPTWYTTSNILYPAKLSIEQTSSEECANYKASQLSGKNLIDLTGGFGVDCHFFAQRFTEVVHCEIQEELSALVKHNATLLGTPNITHYSGDSLQLLVELNQKWDCIYLDPARRNQSKEKVFFLTDCLPNVPENLKLLFNYTSSIAIKTSPLLDLDVGLNELKYVKEIHIVALNNEVKELLWILEKGFEGCPTLYAVNLSKEQQEPFVISFDEEGLDHYEFPQNYLYEPNAAILKTGKFNCIAKKYPVRKLQEFAHLYTSNELVKFPGRSFKIDEVIPFSKGTMKQYLEGRKANITTRNFPMKVEEIRKKWKVKDGGDQYVFFTTLHSGDKVFILCTKLTN